MTLSLPLTLTLTLTQHSPDCSPFTSNPIPIPHPNLNPKPPWRPHRISHEPNLVSSYICARTRGFSEVRTQRLVRELHRAQSTRTNQKESERIRRNQKESERINHHRVVFCMHHVSSFANAEPSSFESSLAFPRIN
jgi:hypothetical protein